MKVKICSNYGPLPKWWDNFLVEHRNIIGINVALTPYGCRYSVTYDEGGYIAAKWLEFERECDYTWFILRWS